MRFACETFASWAKVFFVLFSSLEGTRMNTHQYHSMDVSAALKDFRVDPASGLTSQEAASRLSQYGLNELSHEEKGSPWALFFNQFKNILMVILIVATVLSAFVGE